MQRERGVILIVVLWLVTVLAITAAGIAYSQRTETYITRNGIDRTQTYALARAGVESAMAALHEHGRDEKHAPGMDWWSAEERYAAVPLGRGCFTVVPALGPDKETLRPQGGTGTVVYGLADEESKINVNNASFKVLAGLKGISEGLAKAIVHKRTELAGAAPRDTSLVTTLAEARQEKAAEKTSVLDTPFRRLEDLLSVPGMTREKLFGSGPETSGLSAWLTTGSSGRINVNSAPKEVLQAVGVKEDALDAVEQKRRGSGHGFKTVEDFLTVSGLLKPNKAADETRGGGEGASRKKRREELKKLLAVRSGNFHFASVAQVGRGPRVAIQAALSLAEKAIRVTAWRVAHLPPEKDFGKRQHKRPAP